MFYEWLLWPAVLSTAGRLPSVYLPVCLPVFSRAILRPCQGGSHVACLNVKTSCVGVYKCFTLLSEIGQKFFVFVGILEKRGRNHYSSSISQLTFRVLNTIVVSWFHFMLCCYFLGHVTCRNLPWQGLDIHVNLFLNNWSQLYKRWKGYRLDKSLSLSSGYCYWFP